MEKLKTFLNSYFWLVVFIGLLALGSGSFYLFGKYSEAKFDATIKANQTEASQAKTEAQNANSIAANFSIERRTEDAAREKVIVPKLETARKNSRNSKIELEKARSKYENEKINHPNVSSSRTDNCARLSELFPNTNFEYCAGQK